MPTATVISTLVLLPLASFVLNGLLGQSMLRKPAGWFSTLLMFVSCLLAIYVAYDYFLVSGKVNGIYTAQIPWEYEWLRFSSAQAGFSINLGFVLDPLSVMMLVVVTLISLMVHVFSLWYMKGEERYAMYYGYLGLFSFSMLGLVLSTNIFQLYMCWELVGLSSFLLIGYYYTKPAAVAAAKKAFIVTRFADFGFLIGILLLSYYSGSFDFNQIIAALTNQQGAAFSSSIAHSFIGISALSWGLALVFIGGAGKSALFPLHIWLPDAMEGPTPVSALIHAATMVVAGVFLVARLFPVYAISNPALLQLIGFIGAFTAIFAALIACTQTDIKRVLAYSTMSQIGYMIFALGVGSYDEHGGMAYTASLFHLFTHALFKAMLFLGAGAVIHYVHSNDVKDMGGLRSKLPVTHISFLIGCLAISGFPLLSGFFSKEAILHVAYLKQPIIYWIGLITSGITAFYMFRLYLLIFWNKPYTGHAHHGEGNGFMKLPLLLLALGTILVGWIPFGQYISYNGVPLTEHADWLFSITPVSVGLLGIATAWMLFGKANTRPVQIQQALGPVYKMLQQKFYIDELYQFITKQFLFGVIGKWAAWFDRNVVDGLMNGLAFLMEWIAEKIKYIQSGRLQHYALYFMAGIFIIVWVWMKWMH